MFSGSTVLSGGRPVACETQATRHALSNWPSKSPPVWPAPLVLPFTDALTARGSSPSRSRRPAPRTSAVVHDHPIVRQVKYDPGRLQLLAVADSDDAQRPARRSATAGAGTQVQAGESTVQKLRGESAHIGGEPMKVVSEQLGSGRKLASASAAERTPCRRRRGRCSCRSSGPVGAAGRCTAPAASRGVTAATPCVACWLIATVISVGHRSCWSR